MLGEAWSFASGLLTDTSYETFGIAAVWTPRGGGVPLAVTLLPDATADIVDGFGVEGRFNQTQRRYRVRVSDVTREDPAARPQKGDQINLGDEILTIQAAPRKPDDNRREWQFELG